MAFIHEHGIYQLLWKQKIVHSLDILQGVHTLGPDKNFVYCK